MSDVAQPVEAESDGFMRRLGRLAGQYFNGDQRWRARGLAAGVLGLTILQVAIQVRINLWNRDFFNALENRDRAEFFGQMGLFVALAVASMATAVYQLYLKQSLQLHWRRWLVRRLQSRWLEDGRHYQLNFLPDAADNPDQRISENTRWATAIAVDMAVGLVSAALMLVSFVGILWGLSGSLFLSFGGTDLEIPGYMVFAALLYAGIGSFLTWRIGRPMVAANLRRNEVESDHRYALVRLRESSEGIALIRGEADEERNLGSAFDRVVDVMRDLLRSERRLMWLTSAYGLLLQVFPVLVASPRYFAGAITLGGLMQIAGAFAEVTRSLNWFVDNFPRIADWQSHVDRVAALEDTLGAADPAEAESTIAIEEGPAEDGREILAFRDLSVDQADGGTVIDGATAEIQPGERVLIVGESGTGKSTLFRAIAGLWPWGSGSIRIPPRDRMMFMPQRPYLPLGTLAAAVAYPAPREQFGDAAIVAALERCALGNVVDRLGDEERWDRVLSLGEQQRLAFARLLLHRPAWVFMDEATAALDDGNQDAMMGLFTEELAESALLSIGHRPGLDAYHHRTLVLVRGREGARLTAKRRVAKPRPAKRKLLAPGTLKALLRQRGRRRGREPDAPS